MGPVGTLYQSHVARVVWDTTFMAKTHRASILLCSVASCARMALPDETTLEAYARANVLTVYTVAARQETGLPLTPGDQINNLAVGDKVITLSRKGLTS